MRPPYSTYNPPVGRGLSPAHGKNLFGGLERRGQTQPLGDAAAIGGVGLGEAIKIHHLVPSSHEVTHERLLRVVASIDFREGSELGVRTEDELDDSARPLELARRPIAPSQHAFGC